MFHIPNTDTMIKSVLELNQYSIEIICKYCDLNYTVCSASAIKIDYNCNSVTFESIFQSHFKF